MKKQITAVLLCVCVLISLLQTVPVISQATARGDVNGDGKITSSDSRLALRAAAKLEGLRSDAFAAADANGDGRITSSDARAILRVAAKLESFDDGDPVQESEIDRIYNLANSLLLHSFDEISESHRILRDRNGYAGGSTYICFDLNTILLTGGTNCERIDGYVSEIFNGLEAMTYDEAVGFFGKDNVTLVYSEGGSEWDAGYFLSAHYKNLFFDFGTTEAIDDAHFHVSIIPAGFPDGYYGGDGFTVDFSRYTGS